MNDTQIIPESNIPYAIVGSGLLGLVIAYELVCSCRISGSEIFIFDEACQLSSRLSTYPNINGTLCELGAGRFNPVLHPLLHNLLKKFYIKLTDFKYEITHRKTPNQHAIRKFSDFIDFSKSTSTSEASFFDYACFELGKEQAKFLCDIIGYRALQSKHMSMLQGLNIIQNHPESIFRMNIHENWLAPVNGFSELMLSLTDFLKTSGVNFLNSMRLCKITEGQRTTQLDWIKKGVEKIQTNVKNCFFALPISTYFNISNTFIDQSNLTSKIVDVPLFKCFLGYKNSWWDDYNMDKKCVLTGCELQKIYFNSHNNSIFFYCDSENATYFNRLWEEDGQVFLTKIVKKIALATFLPLDKLESSNTVVAKFWPHGVHFLKRDYSQKHDGFLLLNNHSFVCSDLFTHCNGWMEGALLSARSVSLFLKGLLSNKTCNIIN